MLERRTLGECKKRDIILGTKAMAIWPEVLVVEARGRKEIEER